MYYHISTHFDPRSRRMSIAFSRKGPLDSRIIKLLVELAQSIRSLLFPAMCKYVYSALNIVWDDRKSLWITSYSMSEKTCLSPSHMRINYVSFQNKFHGFLNFSQDFHAWLRNRERRAAPVALSSFFPGLTPAFPGNAQQWRQNSVFREYVGIVNLHNQAYTLLPWHGKAPLKKGRRLGSLTLRLSLGSCLEEQDWFVSE